MVSSASAANGSSFRNYPLGSPSQEAAVERLKTATYRSVVVLNILSGYENLLLEDQAALVSKSIHQ